MGCAQGRSAFPFRDLDIDVIGVDISKELVRQAVARRRHERCTARYTFLVADASHLPLRRESMDHVVVYGVLHHLPQPGDTCQEIHRILKPGGRYFGSENHASFLRGIFDLLMKIKPLWFEEAGAEPLLSRAKFERWLAGLPCSRTYSYSVFVPPHLVNLLGSSLAETVLRSTDAIGNLLPGVRQAGGLILVEMEKHSTETEGWASAARGADEGEANAKGDQS